MRRYGATWESVTVDHADIIQNLKLIPQRVNARVVFQYKDNINHYIDPCRDLSKVADLTLCVCDSSALAKYQPQELYNLTVKLLTKLRPYLTHIEIGNEVNGEWTGREGDVVKKIAAVSKAAMNANIPRLLTLYLDGDDPRAMMDWDQRNRSIRRELTGISWYPNCCQDPSWRPGWNSIVNILATRHPTDLFLISEYGTETGDDSNPNPATPEQRAALISEVESIVVTHPNWVHGGHYWDWQTDVVAGSLQLKAIQGAWK